MIFKCFYIVFITATRETCSSRTVNVSHRYARTIHGFSLVSVTMRSVSYSHVKSFFFMTQKHTIVTKQDMQETKVCGLCLKMNWNNNWRC